jgi:hypothetical protein
MDDNESLSHTKWECKYHVVFIRNADGKRYTWVCESISGRYFGNWLSRRRAGLKKAI